VISITVTPYLILNSDGLHRLYRISR